MKIFSFVSSFAVFILILSAANAGAQDIIQVPPRGGTGSIEVLTEPEKAIAYLGGQKLGKTPVEASFASGRYTLTILLDGEELVNERVNIWPGQKTTIEKKLVLPYGSIELTTIPSRCNVLIDGEDATGTDGAPLTINNVEAGVRLLKVSCGKKSKEVEVDVLGEQTVKVTVDFTKK